MAADVRNHARKYYFDLIYLSRYKGENASRESDAMRTVLLFSGFLTALSFPAWAQDVQTYLYDANGRLIAATTARPASGVYATYALDDADNRTARSAWATTGPAVAGRLSSGESLVPGQSLSSGVYSLTLQSSGDLVVTGPSGVVQHSCTGTGRSLFVQMETNGNLVIRDVTQAILWQSHTSAWAGAELFLNSDGALAIRSGGVTRWSGAATGGGCF